MIYVTKEQVAQVKYLLEQAMMGNHILFDSETIRRALDTSDGMREASREQLNERFSVETHIEKVMSLETIPQKKAYLERLPSDTFAAVVRTYVSIVENTLLETGKVKH